MSREPETPVVEAPAPIETPGVIAMRERVSQRLFGVGTPQRLGRYVIERRLGAGGMGVVYAAFDAELSRKVAIKVVRTDPQSRREQERLRDEARALAQLSHPNVVQIHEVGVHEDQLYLVMEHIEGQTLDLWARERTTREILRCCLQAGEGLAAAHEVGILHRDIKPNNIVVGQDGRVRVVDFGLARATDPESLTPVETDVSEVTSRVAGTPAYLAPELYAGRPSSPLSDQFSFCVTVWQVLGGARPFTAEQLLDALDEGVLRPRISLRPAWVRRVLLRGLDPVPEARWPSIAALLHELDTRPRRRVLSVTFAGVALVTGLLALALDDSSPSCPDPAPIFDEIWNDARRGALEGAMSGREGEFELLARVIDDHREAWLATYDDACTATRIEGFRSDRQLELATACLQRDRARVDGLLELLESPTADPADTRRLLAQLDAPERCVDADELGRQISAPPELAPRVAELRERIDRIALLANTRPEAAGAEAERVVAEARELDFRPALAEALVLDGDVAVRRLDPARALTSLREAARLAKAIGDLRLEFRCLRRLVELTTEQLEDAERGADLQALMLGSFEQLGQPRALLDDALVAQSELAILRGELGEAEGLLRRALELLRGQVDAGDLRLDHVEIELANVVAYRGRLDEALSIYEGLLSRLRGQLGDDHPDVATVEFNLAVTMYELGHMTRARAYVERALSTQRAAFGSDSVKIAPALVVLAQAKAGEGDIEGALAATREAWPLERTLPADSSERGNSLRVEAALLAALERHDAALAVNEKIQLELGPSLAREDRYALDQTLGWLLCRVDRCDEARPHFEAAQRSEQPMIASFAELGLAELELGAGQATQARGRIEQALVGLELLPDTELAQPGIAEARFLLLRCAIESGASPERVRELSAEVRAAYSTLEMPTYIAETLDALERGAVE